MRIATRVPLAALLSLLALPAGVAAAPPPQKPPVSIPGTGPGAPALPVVGLLRVTVAWPPKECGHATSPDPCSFLTVSLWDIPSGPTVDRKAKVKPGSPTGECSVQFDGLVRFNDYRIDIAYNGTWAGASHCTQCVAYGNGFVTPVSFPTDSRIELSVVNWMDKTRVCPVRAPSGLTVRP